MEEGSIPSPRPIPMLGVLKTVAAKAVKVAVFPHVAAAEEVGKVAWEVLGWRGILGLVIGLSIANEGVRHAVVALGWSIVKAVV